MRLALYRKYRSADFDDVIGQSHISTTLQTAVARDLISHAYLFTGPRGVGKTSVARILARAVNQLPVGSDLSEYLDIIEIDAASNRGIDEIRTLRERIASTPAQLKYKVYIIDEAHMLTREAFNALLKTLEEPPSHAIFILATTEAHKLPDTIISRTQRFDFRPIGLDDLIDRLDFIAKQENITIDRPALSLLATTSQGGFRDAISLLDQISVLDQAISEQTVADFLGLGPITQIEQLIEQVVTHQPVEAVASLQAIIERGIDPVNLTNQLLDTTRAHILSAVEQNKAQTVGYIELADRLIQALADFKVSSHYSLPLELAIVKASTGNLIVATAPASQIATAKKSPNKTIASTIVNTDNQSLLAKALSLIKEKNNSLYALLRSAQLQIDGVKFIVECRFSFHKERIEEVKNRQLVEQALTKVFSRPIELVCRLTQAEREPQPTKRDNELVNSALEILGGEVVGG